VDLFRTPPFPKIRGNRGQKDYAFKNLIEIIGIVKKLEHIQNLKETSQIPYDYMKTLPHSYTRRIRLW